MAELERPRITCPIDGCDGIADTHAEGSVEANLHTRASRSWPEPTSVEWPMWIDLVISAATYPFWALSVDLGRGDELTPIQAGYMAAELNLNALYVNELNKAIVPPTALATRIAE
ncbi:hypothetical protein [Lacisediminihabitans profunda]|uniref:Uncharacterized protein n=1 Tax=Lacisediminihabitans profunda TaxID=2594790 RepID=A0A5C8UN35_9MICO|nr:hypothetical protein [Lacisediminihabitans profunda]TXN29321.1 hypothetical protein FVP33_14170 [Lacisediminihabitans profunda]